MYYGYNIISGKDKPGYILGGEYRDTPSPSESDRSSIGSFIVMYTQSSKDRIRGIDDMVAAAEDECSSLSLSAAAANDAVKVYVLIRITELQSKIEALEEEKRLLISEAV